LDLTGPAGAVDLGKSRWLTVDRQVSLLQTQPDLIVEYVVVRQHEAGVTTALRQLNDGSLFLHFLAEPGNPLTQQRRRETRALEKPPKSFVSHHRHEAVPLGQTQDMPDSVIELGPVDPVAVRTLRQERLVDVAQVDRVLDPLLVLRGRTEPGSKRLDCRFRSRHGQQQDFLLVQGDGITAEFEPGTGGPSSPAGSEDLDVERTDRGLNRFLPVVHGLPRQGIELAKGRSSLPRPQSAGPTRPWRRSRRTCGCGRSSLPSGSPSRSVLR